MITYMCRKLLEKWMRNLTVVTFRRKRLDDGGYFIPYILLWQYSLLCILFTTWKKSFFTSDQVILKELVIDNSTSNHKSVGCGCSYSYFTLFSKYMIFTSSFCLTNKFGCCFCSYYIPLLSQKYRFISGISMISRKLFRGHLRLVQDLFICKS